MQPITAGFKKEPAAGASKTRAHFGACRCQGGQYVGQRQRRQWTSDLVPGPWKYWKDGSEIHRNPASVTSCGGTVVSPIIYMVLAPSQVVVFGILKVVFGFLNHQLRMDEMPSCSSIPHDTLPKLKGRNPRVFIPGKRKII